MLRGHPKMTAERPKKKSKMAKKTKKNRSQTTKVVHDKAELLVQRQAGKFGGLRKARMRSKLRLSPCSNYNEAKMEAITAPGQLPACANGSRRNQKFKSENKVGVTGIVQKHGNRLLLPGVALAEARKRNGQLGTNNATENMFTVKQKE